jgi:hypothetical protein
MLMAAVLRVRQGFDPRLPRGLFNKVTTFSTSVSKRKSCRKLKLKKHSESNKTTRDRMRVLLETNQLPTDAFSRQKASQLLELAQSRLSFFRNKIYQNWNPDYLSLQHKRPNKLDVVMDARWWTWNIAFALLPAVLIAAFCELRGKPLVEKYRKQQRERQEKQQLSNEHPKSVERTADDESSWSLLTVVRNLVLREESSVEQPTISNRSEMETSNKQENTRADTTSTLITVTQGSGEVPVSTETLLRRIQELERRLGIDTTKQDGEDFTKQSGIRNRAMAEIRSNWEEGRKESETPQTDNSVLDALQVSEWVKVIKSTVSSLFRQEEASAANDTRKDEADSQKQTATPDIRDMDSEKVHEDEVPSFFAQTEDSESTTKAGRAWWKFW